MIICTDPILQYTLKRQGIDAVAYDNVLTDAQKQEALEVLDTFLSGWFLASGDDCTEYRQVSLGAAMRDEMMILFQMVAHMLTVLDFSPSDVTHAYHSSSCRFPDIIITILEAEGVKCVLVDADYPYVCFKTAWERNAKGSYGNVNLLEPSKLDGPYTTVEEKRPSVPEGMGVYYALVMRNLNGFFAEFLQTENHTFSLSLTEHSKLLPDYPGFPEVKPANAMSYLNERHVVSQPLGRPDGHCPKLHAPEQVRRIIHKIETLDTTEADNAIVSRLATVFYPFFKDAVAEMARQVDRLFELFSPDSVRGAILEVAHALVIQVFSVLKKRVYMVAPNVFLHNQYFTPYLAKKTREALRILVHSEYDRSRYERFGIPPENTLMAPKVYMRHRSGVRPFRQLRSLEGKNVLVIPYFAPALFTFRLRTDGHKLLGYISEVLSVLEECKASKATIRQHPGMDGYVMNELGYTFEDFNTYVFQQLDLDRYTMSVEVQDSQYSNVADSIEDNDLVVGTLSGTVLDTLELGRNYIIYDQSCAPFPEKTTNTIAYDGYIPTYQTLTDFRAAMLDFKNIDRDRIMRECYPAFGAHCDDSGMLFQMLTNIESDTVEHNG